MIGTTLGSYKVLSEIGSGGMGVVYLAEHTLLGRKAAVKLLKTDMPNEYVERFFNEAKAAATLHHPGLVDVYDFGHHSDGSAYIVMEFLPGESLAERLAREPKLPVPLSLAIARGVATALHVAHEQGIVHRDLKPGNIFLSPDPESHTGLRPKVLDFGIAKLVRERDARSVQTQSGTLIGTPRYMSPEQCKNARDVDGRSDIYSLGCILYEMMLGVAPFDYDSWAELVGAHIYEEPARPQEIDANIPADVETLVTKMLEKSPDHRFSTMQELAQSLEVLLLTHAPERVRLTPPVLKRTSTPPRGVSQAAQDPTLPSSGERVLQNTPPRPIPAAAIADTGVFADTDMARASKQLGVPSVPTPVSLPASPAEVRPQRKVPLLAIGIGAVGVAALGIAVVMMTRKTKAPENETAFIVVDQRGSSASPQPNEPPKPVDPDPVPSDKPATNVVPATVDAGMMTVRPPPRDPNETDVAALTRTFGKQGPAITNCFTVHGQPKEKVSVRIQIDTSGAVTGVEVLPPTVGSTEIGGCLEKVARATKFGAQPKAAAFRVPLFTR